jgi:hypothetical protein
MSKPTGDPAEQASHNLDSEPCRVVSFQELSPLNPVCLFLVPNMERGAWGGVVMKALRY